MYAVLEVKQDLAKQQIEYAGEKIASVRRLRRTSAEFPHATGRSRTQPKGIVGGIVTFESGWSPPMGHAFEASLRSAAVEDRLDLGCALCDGGFEVVYGVDGAPELRGAALNHR